MNCFWPAKKSSKLGKAALRSITPTGAMSFAGLGVPARVAALLSPPMNPLRPSTHAALWGAMVLLAWGFSKLERPQGGRP